MNARTRVRPVRGRDGAAAWPAIASGVEAGMDVA